MDSEAGVSTHTEVLVGQTVRAVTCVLCGTAIEVGQLAAYTKSDPPGSRHVECHLKRRAKK
jgi:hypothetical protein